MEKKIREKEFLYWLCQLPGTDAGKIRRIGEEAHGFENAYYIEGTQLFEKGILKTEERAGAFDTWKKELNRLLEEYGRLSEKGIRFVTPLDEEYPRRLLHIYDYPMGLYVKGKLPEEEKAAVAVIGARNCTAYGKQTAEYISRELAENGVQIISGLALGIDEAGHRGAMAGGGATFAVLGCGVNICYPKTNYRTYEQILEKGGILSEYPPGTGPDAWHFPVRNRIISGLSDAVLVMEARKKSGSLITAELGLEQGKDIFALPGRISDALSEGCNSLIESGAEILLSSGQVLEHLGIFNQKKECPCEKNVKGLAKSEKMLYSFLDSEPRHLEELASRANLTVTQAVNDLLSLELKGLAVRFSGLYYVRKIR